MQIPGADLDRFHAAHNAGSPSAYSRALAELRSGRKRSHWIWFVLPQLAEPGLAAATGCRSDSTGTTAA